ncbi:MarR family winged helix-turn-helix transcriptional regulator [Nocardioides sp. Root151]|uniref:MarR family winged helix-turn-helix transcriptional regulator n=1 Tax=Nocardioides sp. Root151 TaxID=1736475 RepID=UPI000702F8FB|nr:MarR family winged helix-turn-helix transcriptional regulator [Nocardioides sp. Root151]KQZ75009.1 hypothetical protein ASD66_01120 [Nocardioides sp. Root151]
MVKHPEPVDAFDVFSHSLFRLPRALRTTGHLWVQLPGNLKRADVTLLKVLADHGDCRPGFIAEQINVGPSVISRQLASLDADGLVVRRPDPDDGRAELISLTAAGAERLTALRAAYVSTLRAQFTDWDEVKVLRAARLLDEISDRIASIAAQRAATSAHSTEAGATHAATTNVTEGLA